MKVLISLSIIFVMIATCNAANDVYASLSMSLRNQLSHVRRLEREEDKILNDILYLDEMQQSKMPSPRLDQVERAFLGFDKKDTDTNAILQMPAAKGTYGCNNVESNHTVRQEWEAVNKRSQKSEGCNLNDITDAIFRAPKNCAGIRISEYIGLTATHCLMDMDKKPGICDKAYAGHKVIRNTQFYQTGMKLPKHDIAVLYKKKQNTRNLNCLQKSCKPKTSCKIIKINREEVDVSLDTCSNKKHPESNLTPSKTDPDVCHAMCVTRTNNEPILEDLSGSPVICEDTTKAGRDKWYIRGIFSFKKTTHNDYAMVAMIDNSTDTKTTCDCPVPEK